MCRSIRACLNFVLLLLLTVFTSCHKDPPVFKRMGYKDTVFTNYFKRTTGWVAGDGAYSVGLSNGQSLWLFGDSYIDSYDSATKTVPWLFQVHNAALLMGLQNPGNQLTLPGNQGGKNYFVHGNEPGYTMWPGAGYQDGDTAFVFVSKLWNGLHPDSFFIAKILLKDYSLRGFAPIPALNGISVASAIVRESDYCYVYGIRKNGYGNDLFVMRFPAHDFYKSWEYFDGNSWEKSVNNIRPIHNEFTASFNVCKIKNKYVLITTEFSVGCDQGKNIYVAVSDRPEGPFSNQHSIWELDDYLHGHLPFFYLANPHPEYDNGKQELLITYCINTYAPCLPPYTNGRMDPDIYRPKAIRVPYKYIDPGL